MTPNTSRLPRSGFYYPNKIARAYYDAVQQVVGPETMTTLLRENGLEQYIGAFPAENLHREFDFADFAALSAGVDSLLCPEGKHSLNWEAGVLCFREGLRTFGGLSGFGAVAMGFQVLPLNVKMKMGLLVMVTIFTTLSDQLCDLEEHDDHFVYRIRRCPICWARHSTEPICDAATAMLEEGVSWLTNMHFQVTETSCRAAGAADCIFIIDKTPIR